jgi:hypothetical protein
MVGIRFGCMSVTLSITEWPVSWRPGNPIVRTICASDAGTAGCKQNGRSRSRRSDRWALAVSGIETDRKYLPPSSAKIQKCV